MNDTIKSLMIPLLNGYIFPSFIWPSNFRGSEKNPEEILNYD